MSTEENPSAHNTEHTEQDDLRDEYDFTTLGRPVRGRYASKEANSPETASDIVVVKLEVDVARAFPTARAVNDALRLLIDISQRVNDTPDSSAS